MAASAQRIVLALLAASRGRSLTAPVLVGAGDILGVSANSIRIALSRLTSTAQLVTPERGRYALAPERLAPVAHVRAFRTGFAPRIEWNGRYVGVLTADLPRRNVTLVARRERALELSGFRAFTHGLWLRPDNLQGGAPMLATHLARLGLDAEAAVIEVGLDATQAQRLEREWNVAADARQANALRSKVEKLIAAMQKKSVRVVAAESFWLGDEVLRFLARDPLLPERIADPAPRRQLGDAMTTLDERGYAVWRGLLEALES